MWDPDSTRAETSFRKPIADPGTDPSDGPLVCIRLNQAWRAILAGCTLQVCQPPSWAITDPTQLADVLNRSMDLLYLVATAGACPMIELRLSPTCGLQYSVDGGATWGDVLNWSSQFPTCIKLNQAYVVMADGYSYPPIPVVTEDGTGWVYSG